MALFEYFPRELRLELSLAIAMSCGAEIGELMDMCRPLKEAAARGADAGTRQLRDEWMKKALTLIELADEDRARRRTLSAGAKLERAALYLFIAARMQAHGDAARAETFQKTQTCFREPMRLGRSNCERVAIPYLDTSLAGLYVRAEGDSARVPCCMSTVSTGSPRPRLRVPPQPVHESPRSEALAIMTPGLLGKMKPGRLHDCAHDSTRLAGRTAGQSRGK